MRARGLASVLFVMAFLATFSVACGDPELSDEAEATDGAADPLADTGSPLPGIPPNLGVPL
jgi:hypothetical protein